MEFLGCRRCPRCHAHVLDITCTPSRLLAERADRRQTSGVRFLGSRTPTGRPDTVLAFVKPVSVVRTCTRRVRAVRLLTATWASFLRTKQSSRFRSCRGSPSPEKTLRRRSDEKRVLTRAEITSNGLHRMYRWNGESAVRCRQLLSHTSPATLRGSGDKFVENGSVAMCLVPCACRQMQCQSIRPSVAIQIARS